MADQVASLVLRVDSTQAKAADTALDQLAVTSQKTEKAVENLAQTEKQLAVNTKEAGTAAQTATAANKALGASAAGATMSTGQLNNAMRMLPAQITDITVGLSTGQSPFMVLMQQGGQLKDMFGGIGPAIRAVVGYVAGLLTPITLVTAGVVAMAFAFEKGANEVRAFQNAITMTGGAAGVTANELGAMAKRIGDVRGTTAAAAEALTKLVDTGKLGADSIEGLGRAAILTQAATGRSVDDMVKDYERIADAPTEAITKLNERYHFLTLAVYEQIAALEKEGRQQDAARLALTTYSQAMEERSQQVVQNVGYIEKAWNGAKNVAKEAWDAMLGIGRDLTPQDRIGQIQKELDQIGTSFFHQDRANALRAQLTGLQELVKWQGAAAKAQADEAGAVARGIQARRDLDSYMDSRKGTSLAASLEAENKAFKKATSEFSQDSQEYQDALKAHTDRVAQIQKQFAGPKGAGTVAAGVRELEQARQQEAALRAQLESAVKITTARQELVKFEQRIADLKAKDQLTADEKSVLSNETAIRQQLERNAGLADQVRMQKEAVHLKALEASAQEMLAADRQRYNDQLQGFTGSPRLREQLQAQQQIYREFQRQVRRAAEQEAAGELSPQGYADRVRVLKQSLDDRLALQADYYSQLTAMEADWRNGAIGGLNDYAYEASNVADATRSAFTDAFKGAEDALVTFVTTGKLNFSDLANSIIADLARIAIRQSITGPLASALGSALGGMFAGGGGTPTAGQVAGATQGVNAGLPLSLASGGYTGDEPRDKATGIVHGQEYVLNANTTARLGRGTLDALNAGGPLPMSDSGGGSATPVSTGTAAQGGDAPKVQINLINQSGEQMEAQQGGSRWDAGLSTWICDVVLARARKDRGFRRQLQEPA
ncbi:phage tail tape measure protein [Achromobacter xylosoxidans]|uniref:Phage tail tape measure protein n=1 Tax=Alcaligenes xylosoxydans xylosoxydans TaxID=85698 RepID=A0A1R1JVR2_ALCXX|nr:phage tail tape measure protein [Achromobacter xylosoxidans]OMG89718.1 phage tail tape measure protein [Achromobacter xylosoxidans]